ncbi:hypothetical protein SAMN05660909_02150 [Chitinophaga terrae (ex Kim and Jung 2007)]|uniref:DUF4136 domain-containing protein n=1 Tax=Chitinophaga terrae (ex Kim and Jung 2007) TaxID=408074 RepID=A0A1H4BLP1_9BACT|nr:hypothetical protein [Chitinophaga terrae (ex Kim and Jung 2007)]GEP89641.1 hypothetical protein CTE07_12860 [Chitinophaga terrae (ex Kim and Jung 2007)]SEA49051.1 hypothetical protein SAMN05660909_02150 [Chitinophaga terrae (ex Kim and Jung 2007)]
MKNAILVFFFCLSVVAGEAQTVIINQTPCSENDVQNMPALYYNHSQSKYGKTIYGSTTGFTIADEAKMLPVLNKIEQLEESSRKNFQATGCVMRVSYSRSGNDLFSGYDHKRYGYQLGLYQMVCHVQQHVVKEVSEFRSVLRVNVNPSFYNGSISVGTGSLIFNKTPGTLYWTYDFPADAKLGPDYEKDRSNKPVNVSKYFSERSVLQGRSDNYKDYHSDFLKVNNGDGYVEKWEMGSRYDQHNEKSYQCIDRHYLITRPGIPLFIPVSRKQYLQDMLEYLEVEKANFAYTLDDLLKKNAKDNSDFANQKRKSWQAHKVAYAEIYEARKAKLKELLTTQNEKWLQQPAIVSGDNKTKEANDRLKETGKFYDKESENIYALYVFNPAYWSISTGDAIKPILFEVQFKYEVSKDKQWSESLLNNFDKKFDMNALRKMIE